MWKFVQAATIGTSHYKNGLPCQDDCFADVLSFGEEQYLVCIVSDGAGSAKQSHIGSELACTNAIKSIEATLKISGDVGLNKYSVEKWIENIRNEILNLSEDDAIDSREYACTLLGIVIGDRKSLFFQIGDGSIVASKNNIRGVVFWPQNNDYANCTNFITDIDYLNNLQVLTLDSYISEVALFSDGLQRLALIFENYSPYNPFFDPMFIQLRKSSVSDLDNLNEQLAFFLNSPDVNCRTDDDKTLILATSL